MEDVVSEALSSDPDGDVIRVLGMFGGSLWLSEIEVEVRAMNESLGLGAGGGLREAVERLAGKGLVELEERIRSDLSGREFREPLVRLKNYYAIIPKLLRDEKYLEYARLRRSLFNMK